MSSGAQGKDLSHVGSDGMPRMVDVGHKSSTMRVARAQACVHLPLDVAAQFEGGELSTKKGPVVQTAIIAGTMAAKKTSELIPFCHPLAIERCKFTSELDSGTLRIECEVGLNGKTGVEMEALTGASVAALTVYDMLKALSHDLVIGDVRLLSKTGGKSDFNADAQTGAK
ncbi:MAG: cyclic pyranopterin monophosphate synthase MoaC [Gammaproteobacteria bacterium]